MKIIPMTPFQIWVWHGLSEVIDDGDCSENIIGKIKFEPTDRFLKLVKTGVKL